MEDESKKTSVSFRLAAARLNPDENNPDENTVVLGLSPDHSYHTGDYPPTVDPSNQGSRQPFNYDMWLFHPDQLHRLSATN